MSNILPARFATLERKVEEFILSQPQYKQTCEDIFNQLDYEGEGYVTVEKASRAVDYFFDSLQGTLSDFSIPVKRPTPAEVLQLHREVSPSSNLNLEQFEAFYTKILKFAAKSFVVGFTERYGLGIIAATAGLFVVKRLIRTVPVVGSIASPILTVIVPTLLAGPLIGCAAVYAADHGGISSLTKLLPKRSPQFRSD